MLRLESTQPLLRIKIRMEERRGGGAEPEGGGGEGGSGKGLLPAVADGRVWDPSALWGASPHPTHGLLPSLQTPSLETGGSAERHPGSRASQLIPELPAQLQDAGRTQA